MGVSAKETAPTALGHLTVADLSDSIAGQFCGRLFADYGAEVLLVEPARGSPVRAMPPMSTDGLGESLLFRHLNAGKRSVALDPTTVAGRRAQDEILAASDVAILPAGADARHFAVLCPKAVIVAINNFAPETPLAHWKGPEIVIQALSGMMHNNGACGRQPLYGTGDRSAYAAGQAAYIGATTALYAREALGTGQIVSIDRAETAVAMAFPYVMQFIYSGHDRSRAELSIPAGQVLCRGGWVCIWIYNFRWKAVCETLGLPELTDDPRFADPATRRGNWDELFRIVQKKVGDRDAEELVGALQDAEVIAAVAYRPSELHSNRHLAARHYWQQIDTSEGSQTVLGPPFRMSRTPRRLRGGAPCRGDAAAVASAAE
ncbi:CoA transferase [soil metagenome]